MWLLVMVSFSPASVSSASKRRPSCPPLFAVHSQVITVTTATTVTSIIAPASSCSQRAPDDHHAIRSRVRVGMGGNAALLSLGL